MSDKIKWKRARLIPVVGTKRDREAEQRATSAFLAVLSIVRDFSKELLAPMGASSAEKATVDTYTEVSMDEVRPDGVIRVTWGKRSFTGLVEVKTGTNKLDKDQVKAYIKSARKAKYDHVLTISNEIASAGAHPIQGLGVQTNSLVQVSHLSWVLILSTALRLKNHKGVDDPEQAWILEELVRYLQHDASGVLSFGDMGRSWLAIRDNARTVSLSRRTEGLKDVAQKLDELHEFAALQLSTEIGCDVTVIHPKALKEDQPQRIESLVKAMIDGNPIRGQFRIPNTAGDIVSEIDLRARQMTVSIEVKAPADKGALGRINWILRQLGSAPENAVLEAYRKKAQIPNYAKLGSIRDDKRRSVLLGEERSEPHRFVVKMRARMEPGRKASGHKPGFVDGYMGLLFQFYEEVVQNLTAWQPPAPKRKATVVEADEATE